MVFGECANNSRFRNILHEEVRKLWEEEPEKFDDEPISIAAMGAAELAKKEPFDPYKHSHLDEALDL